MKTLIFALTALLFSLNLFSQPYDVMINPFWNFYSDNYTDAVSGGMGFAGISTSGDITSANINPASLNLPGKFQAALQYNFKTTQQWGVKFGFNDVYLKNYIYSGSAAFGYRINKMLQTGLIYNNPRSMNFYIADIVITNEFGEELGRTDAYDKYVHHKITIPLVFRYKILSLGIGLNYNINRRYFKYSDTGILTAKFDKFNIHAGMIISPFKELSIGVTFKPGLSGDAEHTTDENINTQTEKVILPLEFGAGISVNLMKGKLKIAADYNYLNSSANTNNDYGLKDIHRINTGVEYTVNKQWQIRAGFFNQPDPRKNKNTINDIMTDYNQYFLTAGASYVTKKMKLSFAIMDSHISSGDIKLTILNGGFTYNF